MGVLWIVLQSPSDTVISIFTAKICAVIKAQEQIKDSVAYKYIIFSDQLSCLQALHYMKLEHPLIGMVI